MALKEKIQDDLISALKEKKEIEVTTLRMLNAAILDKEKDKRAKLAKEDYNPPTASSRLPKGERAPELTEKELVEKSQLTDEEIVEVVSSEAKKRKEAILEFEKGEREDLVEKEKKEIEVLKKYLPEQLPEEEIKKLAQEVIDKVGATEMKDVGKVMSELMPQVRGRAEGGLVSKIVKDLLTSTE